MKPARSYHITDVIDIAALGELFQRLSDVTEIATALLDLEGNILIATNWQDICTQFHRTNPETAARCATSDTVLAGRLEAGQRYNVYRCRNGLIDVAVPIRIGDLHVGNLFTGQFFFKEPEREYFERQARRFGFDHGDYLEALSRVPIFTRYEVEQAVDLLCKMAEVIGEMGLTRLRLTEANRELRVANEMLQEQVSERRRAEAQLKKYHDRLEKLVEERTAELDRTNRLLHQDIRWREAAEEQLRQANRELEAFVYTVSHDLRTPLTPIIGYAQILLERYHERLDEEARDMLTDIHSQGTKMLALMEDLLVLAKVGHIERPSTSVSADEAACEVVRDLGSRMAEQGACVKLNPLPAVHLPKSVLILLFDNLIGNAVRYAPGGGPIEVGGERREDRVRYFVRDHGPGIPEKEREQIFTLFFRGASGQKVPGTGVGLATVQKIARVCGGRAWVVQMPGGGSTFWIEMRDVAPEADGEER